MTRAALAVAGALAVVWAPWPLALAALLASALAAPATGILLGALADILYWTPASAPVPWFTLAGTAAAGASLVVRRFVKARIMG